MTHYTVQFNSAIPETLSSLKQESFQETLENWRGTHQLDNTLISRINDDVTN